MATFTSMLSSPAFQTRMFLTCSFRPQHSTFLHNQNLLTSYKPSRKLARAQLNVPDDAKSQFNTMKEKLWQSVPDSVKGLEWKKAGDVLQHQLALYGKKTLVWLFVAWFGLSCISDFIYSASVSKELIMPLGLFAGCLLTDFVKETSLELFPHSKAPEHLARVGCLCLILKVLSTRLPVLGQVFAVNVANGGLLQVLWLWRNSVKEILGVQ